MGAFSGRSMVATVGCVLGLAARAEAPAHVLVFATETLSERQAPEAVGTALRMALGLPGLSDPERARLEAVRVRWSLKAEGPPAGPTPAIFAERPATALLALIDALYQEAQFQGATAVLPLAGRCHPISREEQAQLALRRGILKMEDFDVPGARQAFREALELDRTAQPPDYTPPKTVDLLEETRKDLPALAATAPPKPPVRASSPSLRAWAWAPAAGGAVLGVAGGVLYLRAKADYDLITSHDPSITSLDQVHTMSERGQALQTGAFALLGVGAAALASSAAMALLGGPGAGGITASVRASPGAAGIDITGTLP